MKLTRSSSLLIAFAVIAAVFLSLPLVAIFIRVPWSDLGSMLSEKSTRDALLISMQTSLIAALLSCLFGVPLAWLLARSSLRGISMLRVVCITPMVLPPVVGGIALLTAFGRKGIVGQYLYDWFNISLPFTRSAVVMAQVFVAIPFLVLAVEASFRQSGRELEDAARTLGASPSRVFFTVALPAARPAIVAGLALAWARSLGEFGASITFAGSFPGRTQTLPMAVYELVSVDYRLSLVLSLVLIFISVGVLATMRDRWMVGR
ncbi:unannotated protein [freshwater metagenome]|uniref:Unannotated protein n=1 Tax=freshwater metagenome TaxID=449393 RepID=A0A6J6HZS3_9ZZZZ|nr:molybdate ABC transporter permease subunit [Actinomycetota bacterium]MSZ96747.1 molybdate ABC transporter permease subunit [Actinomycetota bacterium]